MRQKRTIVRLGGQLSWTHHREVAYVPPETQGLLLGKAEPEAPDTTTRPKSHSASWRITSARRRSNSAIVSGAGGVFTSEATSPGRGSSTGDS